MTFSCASVAMACASRLNRARSAVGERIFSATVRSSVLSCARQTSAMDGFAVRAADLPATLQVVGESAAGRPYESRLEPGCAVAISTGAVVPDGADAVVPIERVVMSDNNVEVSLAAEPGAHVRP